MAPPTRKPQNNEISSRNVATSGTADSSLLSTETQHEVPASSQKASSRMPEYSKSPHETSEDILEGFDSDTEELRRIFESFDENADGELSADEVRKSLAKFGIKMTENELASTMTAVDKKHKGSIDIAEFLSLYKFKPKDEKQRFLEEEYEEYLKRAFKVFDNNDDGYISAEELQRVMSTLGLSQCSSIVDCRHMIKGVDLNGDGQVDFQEFKQMMSRKCSRCSATLKSSLEKSQSAVKVSSFYKVKERFT